MGEGGERAPGLKAEDVRPLVEGEGGFWMRSALIQAAVIFSNVVYVVVCILLLNLSDEPGGMVPGIDEGLLRLLTYVLAACSVVSAGVAAFARQYLCGRAAVAGGRGAGILDSIDRTPAFISSQNPLRRNMIAYLRGAMIYLAIAEAPGIFGLVIFLLSGWLWAVIAFCCFSLAVQLALFGTRERFVTLVEEHLAFDRGD